MMCCDDERKSNYERDRTLKWFITKRRVAIVTWGRVKKLTMGFYTHTLKLILVGSSDRFEVSVCVLIEQL
jgi:hypothetical protein